MRVEVTSPAEELIELSEQKEDPDLIIQRLESQLIEANEQLQNMIDERIEER